MPLVDKHIARRGLRGLVVRQTSLVVGLSTPTRLTFENGRSATGQPGNLLVRSSSRRSRTLAHYREAGHACSAGESPCIASLLSLILRPFACAQAEKEGTHALDYTYHDPELTNYSRSVTVGSLAAANVEKVGMLSNAPTGRPRGLTRGRRQD